MRLVSVPGRGGDVVYVVCAPASATAGQWNRQLMAAGRPTMSVAARGSMPIPVRDEKHCGE